jgi:macrolide-specific efflux system membrane fusion protein
VLEGGRPVKRWVKVGWRDDDYTEVVEGLEENEDVILGEVNLTPE